MLLPAVPKTFWDEGLLPRRSAPGRCGLSKAGCFPSPGMNGGPMFCLWLLNGASASLCSSSLSPLNLTQYGLDARSDDAWDDRQFLSSLCAPWLFKNFSDFFLPLCLSAWTAVRLSQPLFLWAVERLFRQKKKKKKKKKAKAQICSWILILLLAGSRKLACESQWTLTLSCWPSAKLSVVGF